MSKKKIILGAVLIVIVFMCLHVFANATTIINSAKKAKAKILPIKSALAEQDTSLLVFEVEYLREDIQKIQKAASNLKVYSFLPIVGGYIADLNAVSDASLEAVNSGIEIFNSLEKSIPNFSFSGWGGVEEDVPNTTSINELSKFLTEELPNYKKTFLSIADNFNSIDPNRYPENFRGFLIRDNLIAAQEFFKLSGGSFDDLIKIISVAPSIFGDNEITHYLVFLQNDKEIRPGGGILEAYAVFAINHGKLSLVKSGDPVFLEEGKIKFQTPPLYLSRYLGMRALTVKEGAYSADFKESADMINKLWFDSPKAIPVDGIVAINTQFIMSLLDTVGDVEISDDMKFTSSNVSELLQTLSGASGSRMAQDKKQKDLIGALLYELLRKSFNTSTTARLELIKVIKEEFSKKDILVFIESGDSQDLLEKYNMAGRVKEFSGDYLYISNANVGRDKANLYVKQSATYEVSNKEDNLTTKLKVSYQNTGDFNSVLNKGYKDFVQIFVPKGAVIVKSQGLKDFVGNGEEFGKTVFSGLIEVAPKTSAEFSLEYTLPKSASTTDGYKLLIQKQPGLNDSSYKVIIDGKSQEFVLEKDKEIIF